MSQENAAFGYTDYHKLNSEATKTFVF